MHLTSRHRIASRQTFKVIIQSMQSSGLGDKAVLQGYLLYLSFHKFLISFVHICDTCIYLHFVYSTVMYVIGIDMVCWYASKADLNTPLIALVSIYDIISLFCLVFAVWGEECHSTGPVPEQHGDGSCWWGLDYTRWILRNQRPL